MTTAIVRKNSLFMLASLRCHRVVRGIHGPELDRQERTSRAFWLRQTLTLLANVAQCVTFVNVSLLLAFSDPRFCLLANDAHKISHRNVDVHEMQAPVRLDLAGGAAEVSDDVVRTWVGGIAVDCHFQVG